jgi:hypothetical protein
MRPQHGERLIDHLSTLIKEAKRIDLRFVGESHIIG